MWERGDKTNQGIPELNGSSVGMAKVHGLPESSSNPNPCLTHPLHANPLLHPHSPLILSMQTPFYTLTLPSSFPCKPPSTPSLSPHPLHANPLLHPHSPLILSMQTPFYTLTLPSSSPCKPPSTPSLSPHPLHANPLLHPSLSPYRLHANPLLHPHSPLILSMQTPFYTLTLPSSSPCKPLLRPSLTLKSSRTRTSHVPIPNSKNIPAFRQL